MKYSNPIIKGFNPDPSICKVEDDYYLVTSSFEFFPGVPIYHSKDLVNWKLISYCLTRKSQLNLEECRNSGGIYAPTIRYHNGMFYMTTTNVSDKGNFIVMTDDIYGSWSEPIWIDQGGIDPSILFEDDKIYFCSTGQDDKGKQCIKMCEIELPSGKKLTSSRNISYGCGGKYPEAPHVYRIGEYYYLMLAEGGTEYGHMVTIQRSESIYGPYSKCPHNPILSHKDIQNSTIQATGHADLFKSDDDNWWLVHLGIRQLPYAQLHNLGRETFLTKVSWDKEKWPVVEENRANLEVRLDLPEVKKEETEAFEDSFEEYSIDLNYNYVRNPNEERYILNKGYIQLVGKDETLSDFDPTFIGVRQKEFEMTAATKISIEEIANDGFCGISAYYNKDYHYDLGITKSEDDYAIILKSTVHGCENSVVSKQIEITKETELKILTTKENYEFYYLKNNEWLLASKLPTAGLSTEGTMMTTFTGTYVGMFAINAIANFYSFSLK